MSNICLLDKTFMTEDKNIQNNILNNADIVFRTYTCMDIKYIEVTERTLCANRLFGLCPGLLVYAVQMHELTEEFLDKCLCLQVCTIKLHISQEELINKQKEISFWAVKIKEHGIKIILNVDNWGNYSCDEQKSYIEFMNYLSPYCIVVKESNGIADWDEICNMIDSINHKLSDSINIEIDISNKMQMAFFGLLKILSVLENSDREIIIDGVWNFGSNQADNINLELPVFYLKRQIKPQEELEHFLDILTILHK